LFSAAQFLYFVTVVVVFVAFVVVAFVVVAFVVVAFVVVVAFAAVVFATVGLLAVDVLVVRAEVAGADVIAFVVGGVPEAPAPSAKAATVGVGVGDTTPAVVTSASSEPGNRLATTATASNAAAPRPIRTGHRLPLRPEEPDAGSDPESRAESKT
jgi:hypothetical protein